MRGALFAEGDGAPAGAAAPWGATMRPVKRSFTIAGHRTSISLEAPFWDALKQAAGEEGVSISQLIARIDTSRGASGLSSAVRVWILARCTARAD